MPDIATTIASPAFRAWHNALRIPNGLDRDVLIAAGVIADDADWRAWHADGWLAFIITATDAQAVALFELVQARLRPEQRAAGFAGKAAS